MMNWEEAVLRKSRDWILAHPRAANHDVPDELLVLWTERASGVDGCPSNFHLQVFLVGFLGSIDGSRHIEVLLDERLVLTNFRRWQEKLLLARLHRQNEFCVEPLPLFEFPADEMVRIRQRPQN